MDILLCKLQKVGIMEYYEKICDFVKSDNDRKRMYDIYKQNSIIYLYETADKNSEYKYIGTLANGKLVLKEKSLFNILSNMGYGIVEIINDKRINEILKNEL